MIRLLIFFALLQLATFADEVSAAFDAANRLYEKGDYAGAETAYEKLAAAGHTSPALLFNLGNAYFKNGHVGRAVAAYREAQQRAPRDRDIRANLRFVLGAVPGNDVRQSGVDRALRLLTLNERGILAAISLWLCFGSLALRQWRPALNNTLSSAVTAGAIFSILFGAWFAQGLIDRATNRQAVVVSSGAVVRFGPLEESQVSFNVRDGNVLKVLGKKDRWTQVSDTSNRVGWIQEADILPLP